MMERLHEAIRDMKIQLENARTELANYEKGNIQVQKRAPDGSWVYVTENLKTDLKADIKIWEGIVQHLESIQ